MPSSFSHAVVGLVLGTPLLPERIPRRYWACAGLAATLVDLDYLWSHSGLPTGHWLAHRGLSHSPLFAAALAALLTLSCFRALEPASARVRIWAGLTLATASHGVLDALSTYGLGVTFLLPVSTRRFFFPWQPIDAGPGPHDHGVLAGVLETFGRELLFLWLPSLVLALIVWRLRQGKSVGR